MDYYTKLEDISKIIEDRRRDDSLVREIRKFYLSEIGVEMPCEMNKSSCVLARHIPVARKETFYAKAVADSLGLELMIPSFLEDRYVNCSAEKRGFLSILFENEENVRELVSGRERNEYDRNKAKLKDIKVLGGEEDLFDFHFNLTAEVLDFKTFDISDRFNGKRALEYYPAFLTLFGGLNCLLEDFHSGESEKTLKKFTENIFEPSFLKVERELGIKPVIYKLPWKNDFVEYVGDLSRVNELIEVYTKDLESRTENGM